MKYGSAQHGLLKEILSFEPAITVSDALYKLSVLEAYIDVYYGREK